MKETRSVSLPVVGGATRGAGGGKDIRNRRGVEKVREIEVSNIRPFVELLNAIRGYTKINIITLGKGGGGVRQMMTLW